MSDDDEEYVGKMECPGIHHSPEQNSCLENDFPELMQFAKDDETAIVYWPEFREFRLLILDGGGSAMIIRFDPWTGRKLPEPLREKLFETLEELGIDADITTIPGAFRDERWWIERNL